MKTKYLILLLVSILAISCENEKVVAPSADFEIQAFDAILNDWVKLDKPYTIVLSEKKKFRVLSMNDSEYNVFFKGDSVKSGKIWIKHVYSPSPRKDYQGLPLVLNNALNRGLAEFEYTIPAIYNVTFVATAVGNEGNDMAFSVNSKESITVIP